MHPLPPGDIWQHIETFLVVPTFGSGGGKMLLAFSWLEPGMLLNFLHAQDSPSWQSIAWPPRCP